MLLALILVSACASPAPPTLPVEGWAAVVGTYPHDGASFTQGLEYRDGLLYESGGGFGTSFVSTSTLDHQVKRAALPEEYFAEGLTVVDDKVWQLTWRNHVAIERDRATLEVSREVPFVGEGWGLCYQAAQGRLVMSDGTSSLTLRDSRTFAVIRQVSITEDGRPLANLNELECVGNTVWANVWYRDDLVRIDLERGTVVEVLHIGQLPDSPRGVLNGIAALPDSDDLLITGKNWQHLYRVRIDRQPAPSR